MADNDTIDDYELINCVATGNATQVWEVQRAGAGQSLAMKILLPEAFSDPEAKKSLKHEATVGKALQHPNIIRITDFKMTRKHGYFVMEYFRGSNLKSMIRNERAEVHARAKKIIECLSQALAYMHEKGWIHKDVKPDNVLVTKGGEVRLIDFSLAGKAGNAVAHAMTKKSRIVIQGTRTYLAPELIRRERLTHSVDIYSLGVMLFEMLTGNPPFRTANPNDLLMMHVRDQAPPPSVIDENITPELDQFVLKLLKKYPKDRPANMNEVFAEVRNLKFFKEDPLEYAARRHAEMLASDAQVQNDKLNSRLDAQRTADGTHQPAPKKKPKPKPLPPQKSSAKSPQAQKQQQPQQPQYQQQPQQPYAPYPGMGYPGMPMPGMGYPGMPMPGYPMQYPGMPGGQPPMQGYPGMPMPGMPYPPMPQQPQPGAASGAAQRPAGPPPTPNSAATSKPAAPKPTAPKAANPSSPPPSAADDLPLGSIDDLDIE